MGLIPDQRPVWDAKHRKGDHSHLRHTSSPFAEIAEPYFPRGSYILELGCGVGRDAEWFALNGHTIVATDGSEVVIQQNQQHFQQENLTFDVLDIRQPFALDAGNFDVVYANLSLHYYSDKVTREVFAEVARVLKPGGVLAFTCKSYDAVHSQGTEVEPNIFVSDTGVTIHLFSEAYTRGLLQGLFKVELLEEVGETYNGRFSKIVRCVAKKTAE